MTIGRKAECVLVSVQTVFGSQQGQAGPAPSWKQSALIRYTEMLRGDLRKDGTKVCGHGEISSLFKVIR